MQVTKNITLDLLETGSPVIIKAKQNDRNTRYISAHLYVDGLAYPVPNGTEIAFRYKKPDGTAGFYDALPDNSPAITVSGNTVTVELVEQVLTVSGCVHCEINMYNAASEKLTTFTFEISVEESVLTDAEIISSDYYNVLTAEIAKALQAVTDATEQAENAAQSAQDAADSAAMSKDWAAGQPVTYNGTPVSIAYAGAQRIASITAYGETPQGGTTEAPVALTGISSVTVNDDVTELPIPRPLHKVGDVMDVCRTRVKSVYDKRVVLDGSSDEVFIQTNIIDGWIQIATESDAVIPESTSIVGSIKSSYLKAYAIEEVYSKKYSGISVDSNRRIRLSFKTSEYPDVTSVETARTYLSTHPLTVYYQSTAYDGTNGLDVCLTEYQTGFVELDGTENWVQGTGSNAGYLQAPVLNNTNESHLAVSSIAPFKYQFSGNCVFVTNNKVTFGSALGSAYTVDTWKAYLAAQKSAGTPVQVVYQLATPETYATDPVDFDNAAGPLTVMTGGEVEVRMTELIGSRSPEFAGKMDRDIYFQVGNLNLGDNTNLLNPVNQQGQASYTGDSTSPYCIDRWRISNGTTYNIVSRTLTASSYANRACGMWQTNELAQQALAIGSTITFSGYINGMQHSGTIKILNRDLYSSFAEVPAGYECDDFEIVCCTASHEQSKYNLGIYPKKEAVLNWIKWEKGLYATPYAPKGFGLEQLECMRYYQTIKGIKYVLRKALASEGFPYVIPVTFMPMRAVPQTDITVTEGAENNLTATGVTQTACGIQFQPVAENVGLTFTLTLSANL